MEVYATMSLVCRRLRAVALASGVMYRNLQLFTNCPGRPFDWMFYLLGKGAHITSRNTRASIRSTWQYQYQEQPDGQLVKKPVLKPVHPKLSLAVARLLARMPELRELRLLDPVYPEALTRALRAGRLCLPTVEVLTMKVAEHHHHHDHTADAHPLVVRACPRLTALGLNMDGPSSGVTGTVDATDCLKAVWRAAGELAVLEEVRVLKFGFDAPCWLPVPGAGEGSRSVTAGWMLDDVDAIHKYVPNIKRLAMYGNIDCQEVEGHPARYLGIEDFAPKIAQFKKLERLLITGERVFNLDVQLSDPGFSNYLSTPEAGCEAAAELFERCGPRLQRVRIVLGRAGKTFQPKPSMVGTGDSPVEEFGTTAELLDDFWNKHYFVHAYDLGFKRQWWL